VARRLPVLLASLLAAVAVGCTSDVRTLPPSTAAPLQSAELAWVERAPQDGTGFVFRVRRFAVTDDGWEADVEIQNRTSIAWGTGGGLAVGQSFGLMLFASGDLAEVDRRMRDRDLPGLRPVQRFDPALPDRLAAGQTWRSTISAAGTLAAGRHVRIAFGPLIADGEPPQGLERAFVWITDHAYELRA
jgi:hypothetical protein